MSWFPACLPAGIPAHTTKALTVVLGFFDFRRNIGCENTRAGSLPAGRAEAGHTTEAGKLMLHSVFPFLFSANI